MKPIELDRTVNAPASRVWAVLTDLDRSPSFMSGILRMERVDEGDGFGVGTRWRETRTMFGKEATEEMEVTAVEPGRSYVVEADNVGVHYVSSLGVEPLGEDRSRVWMRFNGEPTGLVSRLLAGTVGRLFAGTTRKMIRQDLDDIAAEAERG